MLRKKIPSLMPILIPISIQVVTIYLAYKVVEYLNKLSRIPECKKVEPTTREALNIYSYIIMVTSVLNIMLWVYIYFNNIIN